MDDEYPIEGEQEWPYLVREVPDKPPRNIPKKTVMDERTNDEKLDDILNTIEMPEYFYPILRNKVVSFLNSRDCTGLSVDGIYGQYTFVFTRENRYVQTVNEFDFIPELENTRRIFRECYTTHNHDNLIRMPEFQSMISKTGMEFIKCSGGYETKYSMADDEFTFVDEIKVKVLLKKGSSERVYGLDLEKMKLSEDYIEL